MADKVDHSGEPDQPDPDTARTPGEFVAALRGLQSWTGQGLRELEKRAKVNGDVLPRSTLAAALVRSTLPREDLVVALVSACGCTQDEVARWVATRRRIASVTASNPAVLLAGPPADPASQPVTLPDKPAIRPVLVLAAVALVLVVAVIAAWSLRAPDGDSPTDATNSGPLTTPPPGQNQPCDDGWVCLYQHSDFNGNEDGRKLQFQDDYWQPLGEYDFDDRVSSWKNHLGREVCLSKDWPVVTTTLRLPAEATGIRMEPGWDNTASGIKPGPC